MSTISNPYSSTAISESALAVREMVAAAEWNFPMLSKEKAEYAALSFIPEGGLT
jgi:hypothetical protein